MAQDNSGSTERALKQGDHLGPYKIDAVIGAGGMGELFRPIRVCTAPLRSRSYLAPGRPIRNAN
jgi:hypothetical protein